MGALKWLWSNKEWLFSGAGLALISLVFWVGKKISNRHKESIADSTVEVRQAPIIRDAGITPRQIQLAIEGAPLLQKPEVQKHYVGLHVKWEGNLSSAYKTKNGLISVWIRVLSPQGRPGSLVNCEVKPNEYPGLALLKEGHKMEIKGIIDGIDYGTFILKAAELNFKL